MLQRPLEPNLKVRVSADKTGIAKASAIMAALTTTTGLVKAKTAMTGLTMSLGSAGTKTLQMRSAMAIATSGVLALVPILHTAGKQHYNSHLH